MPRNVRLQVPDWARPWLASFKVALHAEQRSKLTVDRYCDAAGWFAAWTTDRHPEVNDWDQVARDHIRGWFGWLRDEEYSPKYCHNMGGSRSTCRTRSTR
jgi:hypothetical protein